QKRNCLICSSSNSECRLGIDCCRACAVFFKRIRASGRIPEECFYETGTCTDDGMILSCRRCRYDRFLEVFRKAEKDNQIAENAEDENENDQIPELIVSTTDIDPEEIKELEIKSTTFIDHNTFMLQLPSSSTSTPILDKIRWNYSLMCRTRKTAENGTKPAAFHLEQCDYEGTKMNFVPMTYSMAVPNARIYLSALYDFANQTFPDFANLDAENKESCITASLAPVQLMDNTYRAFHFFPDDLDTFLASYSTTISEVSLSTYLDDCPDIVNIEDVTEAIKVNIQRGKSMNREVYHRIKPDNVEFTALLGLSFWNNCVAYINEELSTAVNRNREVILKELNTVYKARGNTQYALRLGELFCLLDSFQENVTISTQESELFKLHNLFKDQN
ncbi:hypothetical protein PMAYCL1PPCAC_00247, partial [Pristionchus mayeri]